MKILVASQNPVKVSAVQAGFEKVFPQQNLEFETVSVTSGVSHQPLNNQETFLGAQQRAINAAKLHPLADYWVGVEGGVEKWADGEFTAFAWVYVLSKESSGKGKTGTFFLPPPVAALLEQGKELGEADDIVFGRQNSKQENGAIGLLSGNLIDRTKLYVDAVIFALLPFKNPDLYQQVYR